MSKLIHICRFVALLVLIKVVTRINKPNYSWIIFAVILDVLCRYKTLRLFPRLGDYIHKHYSSTKDVFKAILKPPNASLPYLQRCINSVVYYFTQSGSSNEESGQDENMEISDPETEKPSDGATSMAETSDSSSGPQKRKVETELEDNTKRSKSTAHSESKSAKGSESREQFVGTLPKGQFSSDNTAGIAEEGERSNLCMPDEYQHRPEDEFHSIRSRTQEDENKDADNKRQQVPVPESDKNESEIPQEGIVASSIATEERAERSDREVGVDRIPKVSDTVASVRKKMDEVVKDIRERCEESGSSSTINSSDDDSIQNYGSYPGFSLSPHTVKKDAYYQKKFYAQKQQVLVSPKVRKVIRRVHSRVSEDAAHDIPTIPDSDELSSDIRRERQQELAKKLEKISEEVCKKRKERKQNKECGKTGYTTSSFQEESPPDDVPDDDAESSKLASSVAPLSRPPFEAHLTEANVSPIKRAGIASETGKAEDFASSLQTEKSASEGDLLTSGRTGARPKTRSPSSRHYFSDPVDPSEKVNAYESEACLWETLGMTEHQYREALREEEIIKAINEAERLSRLEREELIREQESIEQFLLENSKERVSTEMSRDDPQGEIGESFQVSSTDEENLKGACKNEQIAILNYEKHVGGRRRQHKIWQVPRAEETFEKKNLEDFGSEEISSNPRSLTGDDSSIRPLHEFGNEKECLSSRAEPATHFESTFDFSSTEIPDPESEKQSDGATTKAETSDSSSAPRKRIGETELEENTKRSKSTAQSDLKSEKGSELLLGHNDSDTKDDEKSTPFSRNDTAESMEAYYEKQVESENKSEDLNRGASSETRLSEEGESSNLCMPDEYQHRPEDESHSISSRTQEHENKDADNKMQQVLVPESDKNESEILQEGIVASSIATEEQSPVTVGAGTEREHVEAGSQLSDEAIQNVGSSNYGTDSESSEAELEPHAGTSPKQSPDEES